MAWQVRAFCECGESYIAPFGSTFHVHTEVCHKCGEPKKTFEVKVCKWQSTSITFLPWTWGNGHWIFKDTK